MVLTDHDEGPDDSSQHDYTGEICQAGLECGGQILRCKHPPVGNFGGHGRLLTAATFLLVQEAERLPGQDPNWRVGAGGIRKEDVILIGVIQVSRGSWQSILQLNCYVVPRCQHIPGPGLLWSGADNIWLY